MILPIEGILICDYFVVRHTRLQLIDLYKTQGQYTYHNGFNPSAIIALLLGVALSVPGFLGTVKIIEHASVGSFLMNIYSYAWFVGFIVAFVVYAALTIKKK
jgi:NCS1 family nucleobase:cation symporter-1